MKEREPRSKRFRLVSRSRQQQPASRKSRAAGVAKEENGGAISRSPWAIQASYL